jgi:hypothetical protein
MHFLPGLGGYTPQDATIMPNAAASMTATATAAATRIGGPAQSFPPVFFSGGRPNFLKLSEEQKKQTDREQHKALFLTT